MDEFPYASRFTRLIGQFLDGFIGACPLIVVSIFAGIVGAFDNWGGNAIAMIGFFAGMGWAVFYYFFSDGFTGGQSWAKQMLGIHVIDANTRRPCSYGQSFLRNLLLALLGPIDAIFIFGDRHQRLGDMLAGTVVIRELPGSSG